MKREVGCRFAMAIIILGIIPGCGKIIDWGKSNFYQGQEYDTYKDRVRPLVRSITLYDQLTTQAHFDVLWLSDEVRIAFADLHAARFSKSLEMKNILLRRQLEENDHYISFYVLSIYGTKLATPESRWTFFLEVDGNTYQPAELKMKDLPYEYQVFFDTLFNRFKEPYCLRFDARDLEDNLIINSNTRSMRLHIRSAQTGYVFTWVLADNAQEDEPVKPQPVVQKSKRYKRGRRQS